MSQQQEHTAYVETLVHVNCGNCDGYWGLSDIDVDEIAEKRWFCTHCGHEAALGDVVDND
jgi:hypothetical protein